MKVKSESEVVQSCPTLRDPMDCGLPGSSVYGSPQAGILQGVAIPQDFSEPGLKPTCPLSPALQVDSVPQGHLGSHVTPLE